METFKDFSKKCHEKLAELESHVAPSIEDLWRQTDFAEHSDNISQKVGTALAPFVLTDQFPVEIDIEKQMVNVTFTDVVIDPPAKRQAESRWELVKAIVMNFLGHDVSLRRYVGMCRSIEKTISKPLKELDLTGSDEGFHVNLTVHETRPSKRRPPTGSHARLRLFVENVLDLLKAIRKWTDPADEFEERLVKRSVSTFIPVTPLILTTLKSYRTRRYEILDETSRLNNYIDGKQELVRQEEKEVNSLTAEVTRLHNNVVSLRDSENGEAQLKKIEKRITELRQEINKEKEGCTELRKQLETLRNRTYS